MWFIYVKTKKSAKMLSHISILVFAQSVLFICLFVVYFSEIFLSRNISATSQSDKSDVLQVDIYIYRLQEVASELFNVVVARRSLLDCLRNISSTQNGLTKNHVGSGEV